MQMKPDEARWSQMKADQRRSTQTSATSRWVFLPKTAIDIHFNCQNDPTRQSTPLKCDRCAHVDSPPDGRPIGSPFKCCSQRVSGERLAEFASTFASPCQASSLFLCFPSQFAVFCYKMPQTNRSIGRSTREKAKQRDENINKIICNPFNSG